MNLSIITNQLIVLFLIILLGYLLYKTGIMTESFNKQLTKLVLHVTMPALILDSVLDDAASLPPKTVAAAFAVAIVMYLLLPPVSHLITLILRAPAQQMGIYDFAGIYGNVGFMGFPLISAILGPDALLVTAIFNIVFNLSAYTIGVLIISRGASHKERLSPKKLLSPGILLSVLAIVVYLMHIRLPQTICSAIGSIGSLTSPLAMMLIGATLATMPVKEMLNEKRTYVFLLLRQIILPLLCWPIMKFLIHDTLLLTVSFIMLSVPVANTCVLFATNYDLDTKIAAKCVFVTTLLCVLTIPVLLIVCLGI